MIRALVAAATAGFATMAVEILSARRLAPAFGLTLATWSLLIAATLLAGAVGALVGARLARSPPRGVLAGALLVGALAVALDAVLGARFVASLSSLPLDVGAGIGASGLVGPAVLAFAAVPPLAIGCASTDRPAGPVAGWVLAASTAGSLVGTLGSALVLVPALGVSTATAVVAAACAVAALACGGRRRAAIGVLVAVVGARLLLAGDGAGEAGLILARDAAFGRVALVARGAGVALTVDGVTQGTRSPLDRGTAGLLDLGQATGALPILHPRARRALVVGLGTGQLTDALADAGLEVTTVDVDPVVVDVVRARWGIPGRVVVGDGRATLRSLDASPGARFDAIALDAFQAEGLPWHLLTREAFAEVRAHLAPSGIVIVHLVGRAEHRVTGAVAATLAAVFAHGLATVARRGAPVDDVFLLASDAPLRWPPDPALDAVRAGTFAPPPGPVLSDDDSPLDRWNEPLAAALRRASR